MRQVLADLVSFACVLLVVWPVGIVITSSEIVRRLFGGMPEFGLNQNLERSTNGDYVGHEFRRISKPGPMSFI